MFPCPTKEPSQKWLKGTLASLELFSTCNGYEIERKEIPFFVAPAWFHYKNYYIEVMFFKTATMGSTSLLSGTLNIETFSSKSFKLRWKDPFNSIFWQHVLNLYFEACLGQTNQHRTKKLNRKWRLWKLGVENTEGEQLRKRNVLNFISYSVRHNPFTSPKIVLHWFSPQLKEKSSSQHTCITCVPLPARGSRAATGSLTLCVTHTENILSLLFIHKLFVEHFS